MHLSDQAVMLEDDPLWYKDAVIYEVHVRAFHDSNNDGIGDFQGLTQKLDYLHDLGVTAIWLLPFYPSPLKDDGYDIADYMNIHPAYGDLHDFKHFMMEAHRRGLRVITELVLNHTSDQHPWFQRARQAEPGSRYRNFYVWSDSPEKYKDARIIFRDFELSNWSWDPIAKAHYWHRFYSHQPDLNYNNPEVQREMYRVVDFWLRLGVDGLRLDAVPYLYEEEGTNCENLPQTHAFLKSLRQQVDSKFKNRMLLGEANQWPADALAYFGHGDECQMLFHFPLMPRLFMAISMEDHFPVMEILENTPQIPQNCQWAVFLRNHDELTLEMVTDEERDYMYRTYARDTRARINLGIRHRLAPLLGNHRRRIELMNGLIFSLSGSPVIYYGDEIGMGDNIYLGDRNGVRTPMQWSADRNAGFSRANPQQLYLPIIIDPAYHYEAVNVQVQQNNLHSLLWWTKRLIATRKRFKAFGRASLQFLHPENRRILAFIRQYEDERILVVANLSRFVQGVELDLSDLKGLTPVEIFGRVKLPPIREQPYFLTLGPHAFYWLSLETEAQISGAQAAPSVPTLTTTGSWENVLQRFSRPALERILLRYLEARRWTGKARTILSAELVASMPFSLNEHKCYLTWVKVNYTSGAPETYALPLLFAAGEEAQKLRDDFPQAVIAPLTVREVSDGVLYDATWNEDFARMLLNSIMRRRQLKTAEGKFVCSTTRAWRELDRLGEQPLTPTLMKTEQSNSLIVYGERWVLKFFRYLDAGIHPEMEIGRFLIERTSFKRIPRVVGALEFKPRQGNPFTLAILEEWIPHQADAWGHTLDALGHYFERAIALKSELEAQRVIAPSHVALLEEDIPDLANDLIGAYYLEYARKLGQLTGELHCALASDHHDAAFRPEPFTEHYRRGLYQSMHSQASQALELARQADLPATERERVRHVVSLFEKFDERLRARLDRKITAMRIRCHGNYSLRKVLDTGKEFVVIDFEGEPARPLGERRIKRSPFRDVAGMLRSFHYASIACLRGGGFRDEDIPFLEPWAQFWYTWTGVAFLQAYLQVTRDVDFLPKTLEELGVLLDLYLIDKAFYELIYELNNRPDWVTIPLQGLLHLLSREGSTDTTDRKVDISEGSRMR